MKKSKLKITTQNAKLLATRAIIGFLIFLFSSANALAATGTLFVQVKKGTTPESGVEVKVFKGIDQVGNADTTGSDGTAQFGNLTIGERYLVNANKGNFTGNSQVTFSQDRQQVEVTISQSSTGSGGTGGTTDGGPPTARPTVGDNSNATLQKLKEGFGKGVTGGQNLSNFISKNETVARVWKSLLALTNIVVVLILLGVAFATIFHVQVDTYGIKKVLPTLIIGIILANLSLLISRNIIDFANVLTTTFIGQPKELVQALSNAMVGGTFEQLANVISGSNLSGAGAIGIAGIAISQLILAGIGTLIPIALVIMVALLILAPAILFAILAFLLYARTVIVTFLVAVSPLAFIAMAFAPTQGLFRQWWSQFMRWVFMAPVVFFFLWLASEFSFLSGEATFATYALSLILLYLAIQVPFKLGGAVMSVYGGVGKKAAMFLGAKAVDRSQSWAERKGIPTPRVIWEQAKKREEERAQMARSVVGAKVARGMYTKYGSPTSGIKGMTGEGVGIRSYLEASLGIGKGRQAREARAEKANLLYGDKALKFRIAQDAIKEYPTLDLAREAAEKGADERLSTPEGKALIKQMEAQQGRMTNPAQQYQQVAKIAEGLGEDHTGGGVEAILRAILQTLRAPGTNKNTAAYLSTILGGMKGKTDKYFQKGTDTSKLDSIKYDDLTEEGKTAAMQELGKLGWGEKDVENMSQESKQQFEKFFGKSDYAEVIKSGPQAKPSIRGLNVTGGVKMVVDAASGKSNPATLSMEDQVNIAVHGKATQEEIAKFIIQQAGVTAGSQQEVIKGLVTGGKDIDDILKEVEKISGVDKESSGYKLLVQEKANLGNVINSISNNPLQEIIDMPEIKGIKPENYSSRLQNIEDLIGDLNKLIGETEDARIESFKNALDKAAQIPDTIRRKLKSSFNLIDRAENETAQKELLKVYSAIKARQMSNK